MAIMRGPLYVWGDGERIFIWHADDPYREFMEVSGWAETYGPDNLGAVAIPEKTWDELVIRAYDEMTDDERARARRRMARKRKGAAKDGD